MRRRAFLGGGLAAAAAASLAASPADLNQAGMAAYGRGDYAAAEQLFTRAAARAPRDPLLHYHRGVALSRLSRWSEATAAYQSALRLGPPPELAATIREAMRAAAPYTEARPVPRRGPEEHEVPLDRMAGGWIAEVVLNDTRTARFLVDTGASICVIAPGLARELGIAPGPGAEEILLQTLSGQTRGPVVRIPVLRVGDAESRSVPAVVHETGPSMDGILGNTFLGRFTVTVDPGRRVLSLRSR
ncbi:MAG TPA: aspartyl protease family protein [Candidatus Binatia bacterium]|nr:aspartyl protease family protein [Candidatus Binatia bacterium]